MILSLVQQCLSPQITECLSRNYSEYSQIWRDKHRAKHSKIWRDKLLSPVWQCLSPQITECLSRKVRATIACLPRDKCCLPKLQDVCLEVKLKQQKYNLLLSSTDYTSLHQQGIQFCFKNQTTNIWHKLLSTYNTTHILANQHLNKIIKWRQLLILTKQQSTH